MTTITIAAEDQTLGISYVLPGVDSLQLVPRRQVGILLTGKPIYQGGQVLVLGWAMLALADVASVFAVYEAIQNDDGIQPKRWRVTANDYLGNQVSYPDVVMAPPELGGRQTLFGQQLKATFYRVRTSVAV